MNGNKDGRWKDRRHHAEQQDPAPEAGRHAKCRGKEAQYGQTDKDPGRHAKHDVEEVDHSAFMVSLRGTIGMDMF